MRTSPAALLCLVAPAIFFFACSSGTVDDLADVPHEYDAASDTGVTTPDTGTIKDTGHPVDAGADAGLDAGEIDGGDAGADSGGDAGRPTAAIQVDMTTVAKVNTRLINGSGLEIENDAQGLGAEMLTDRGFEWDRPWMAAQNPPWETWYFYQDTGVQAKVEWVTDHVYQGSHSFKFTMTTMVTDKNAGIVQGGLGVVKDRHYTFSFWLYHQGGESQFVHVALIDVPDPNDSSKNALLCNPAPVTVDPTINKWTNYTVDLVPNAATKTAAIALLIPYPSVMWLDAFSLTPKDAQHGVWPELVDAFKAAQVSVVRLGGISADGYDWGMGLGPRDKRPVYTSAFADTSLDPDHTQKYMPVYNDVGTDDFLDFCAAIGADALITVNLPLGAQAAANWVEYANGISPGLQKGIDAGWQPSSYKSTDKAPAGYFAWLREFYGAGSAAHAAPWGVKYWEIGNELWDEELPEPGSLKGAQNLSNYAIRANEFATAMKAVDPSIKVGACGGPLPNPGPADYRANWNRDVLDNAGGQIDFLAVHFYAPGDFDYAAESSPEAAYDKIAGTGPFYAQEVGKVQIAIDNWKQGGGTRDIGIAVTEYDVWHGVLKFANKFDVNRLRSVVANASFRNLNAHGPVWMANFYSMVNHPFGMLDWRAESQAAGTPLLGGNYVLQKFLQDHFAPKQHPVSVQSPTYTAHLGSLDPIEAPLLDVTAAESDDGSTLVITVVNREYWPNPIRTAIDLGSFAGASARAYVLTGLAQDAYNDLGTRGNIFVAGEDVPVSGSQLEYTFAQYSVTVLEIRK